MLYIFFSLMATRKLRPPQRRRAAQGKNPLRSSMVEVKQVYTVTKTGIAEKEVKRIKKEGSKLAAHLKNSLFICL